jgi:phosphatidylserine decarboxylase
MKCKVSRESFSFLGVLCLFFVLFFYLGPLQGTSWGWTGFGITLFCIIGTIYFFRDPDRSVPRNGNVIVSPADGKIVHVGTVDRLPFCQGSFKQVAIFLSLWDVHVNRIPADGTVQLLRYVPGRFHPAFTASASRENEQMLVGFECGFGRVFLKQIAGMVARRILCRLEPGQKVTRGERFGMIKFGSRVELYLPMSVKLYVSEGDRIRAGESVIGEMILDA